MGDGRNDYDHGPIEERRRHGDVTQLLLRWRQGDQGALHQILSTLYAELRRLAQSYVKRESRGHTLQATALVHEAYLRLVNVRNVEWQDRNHFFAIAARSMRRVLVEHARKRLTDKRGGGKTLQLDDARIRVLGGNDLRLDLLYLDEALTKLEAFDRPLAQVVEMKFFGGMSNEEMAQVLCVSVSSVKRDWTIAKAWLRVELG